MLSPLPIRATPFLGKAPCNCCCLDRQCCHMCSVLIGVWRNCAQDMDCFFASIATNVSSFILISLCISLLLPNFKFVSASCWGQHLSESGCQQGHPAFSAKPLAVCHSNHSGGSAEISSCNYEARGLGVKAGMSMSTAKSLCPHLLVLPYEVIKLSPALSVARAACRGYAY